MKKINRIITGLKKSWFKLRLITPFIIEVLIEVLLCIIFFIFSKIFNATIYICICRSLYVVLIFSLCSYEYKSIKLRRKYKNVSICPSGLFKKDGFVLSMKNYKKQNPYEFTDINSVQSKFIYEYKDFIKSLPTSTLIKALTHEDIIFLLKNKYMAKYISSLKINNKPSYKGTLEDVYKYMNITKETKNVDKLKIPIDKKINFYLVSFRRSDYRLSK